MRPDNETSNDDEPVGELVPDPVFAREISASPITIWRRDHDPPEAWPLKIRVGARNFRSRPQIENYKRLLLARARERAVPGE